ncbi:MAG: gfo/Idh/MocA family oxidoreductase, partial [Armatimonadetes bacterium]|nr:gfo/Idh/MocA family oxidoreductase [Armatimonadota bacterium]
MARQIKIALVGAGMFGGDVHLRAYADVQRSGLAGFLARTGMDSFAREVADIDFDLVGVATRTPSSAERAADSFEEQTGRRPKTYSGEAP